MTRLEERYRRVLRLLPASYRAVWEEDMVATFLSFVHTVSGRVAPARWLGSAAAAISVVSAVLTAVVTYQPLSSEVAYTIVLNSLLALALAAWHSGAPAPDRRPWLAAFGACLVLFSGHAWLLSGPELPLPPLDWAGLECAIIIAVAAVHLVRQAQTRFGRFSVWTSTLAIIAFAVLGQRLVSLLDYAQFSSAGWHPATVMLGTAEAIAVAAVTAVLVLLSARALRRLPATAPSAAAWSTTPSR